MGSVSAREIVLVPSRGKVIFLLVISALFLLAGIAMVSLGEKEGYLVAGLFGLCLVFGIAFRVPGKNQLTIGDDGIVVRIWGKDRPVRYEQVHEFYAMTFYVHGWMPVRTLIMYSLWPVEDGIIVHEDRGRFKMRQGTLPDTYGMKADALVEILDARLQAWQVRRFVASGDADASN